MTHFTVVSLASLSLYLSLLFCMILCVTFKMTTNSKGGPWLGTTLILTSPQSAEVAEIIIPMAQAWQS